MAEWAYHRSVGNDRNVCEGTEAQSDGQVEPVKIDDASAFLCRFENGSMAMFEATRYARGHKALFTLEINGERASASMGPSRPPSTSIL